MTRKLVASEMTDGSQCHCGALKYRSSKECWDCYNQRRQLPPEQRFWLKVDASAGPDACWAWTGGNNRLGYGRFGLKHGRNVGANRFAWEATFGPIPKGLFVLHKCDNPSCVNPSHLFLGTQKANIADMVRKGRHFRQTRPDLIPRGERSGKAKLTEERVRAIRRLLAAGCSQSECGQRFGVAKATIGSVATRRSWRHVT